MVEKAQYNSKITFYYAITKRPPVLISFSNRIYSLTKRYNVRKHDETLWKGQGEEPLYTLYFVKSLGFAKIQNYVPNFLSGRY